jgi:hypothetical protein
MVILLFWLTAAALRDAMEPEKSKNDLPGLQGFPREGLLAKELREFCPGVSTEAISNDADIKITISERIFPPLSRPLHPVAD